MARFNLVAPPERVDRGARFALLAVPIAVALYLLLWFWGINPGLVPLGVAFGAYALYRRGSGGRVSVRGVTLVIGIVVAASVICLTAGLVGQAVSPQGFRDSHPLVTVSDDGFWETTVIDVLSDRLWLTLAVTLTLLFTAIGSIGVWVSARRSRDFHTLNDRLQAKR